MYHTTRIVGETQHTVIHDVITKNANALIPGGSFSVDHKRAGHTVLNWKLPYEWGGYTIAVRIEPAPTQYFESLEIILEVDNAPSIQASDKLLELLIAGLPGPRQPSKSIWDLI